MKRLPIGRHANSRQILSRISRSTHAKMQKLAKKPVPAAALLAGEIERKIGQNVFSLGVELTSRHFQPKPLPLAELYGKVFAAGVAQFRAGSYQSALSALGQLGSEWLNNPKSEIPSKMGRGAIELARAISSNWVAAHASGYVGAPIRTEQFLRGRQNFPGSKVFLSTKTVAQLGRFGSLKDVVAIKEIERRCMEGDMEITCAAAAKRIIARSALKIGLRGVRLESIGIRTNLSRLQVLGRFEVLFGKLGISSALQGLPAFAVFEPAPVNVVAAQTSVMQIKRLAQQRLGVAIEFGSIHEFAFDRAEEEGCRIFLEEQGLIEPRQTRALPHDAAERQMGPRQYSLTAKGKEIVVWLCSDISRLQVRLK